MIVNPVGVASLARREINRFAVDAVRTIFPPLITSSLFLFIFGVTIGSRIDISSTGLHSYLQFIVPGIMTLHLISTSYENTSASLFIGRWHNHIQEVLLAPLSYVEMVLGLLAGGVMRGSIISLTIYLISMFFDLSPIHNPIALIYFILTISVIFSCAGMMGALWAEDFGMLNLWNIYVIIPLVFIGGVFHPMDMLPEFFQEISLFNPMFYLVQGMRYSVTGFSDANPLICAGVSGILALTLYSLTVLLFKIGYKLRT